MHSEAPRCRGGLPCCRVRRYGARVRRGLLLLPVLLSAACGGSTSSSLSYSATQQSTYVHDVRADGELTDQDDARLLAFGTGLCGAHVTVDRGRDLTPLEMGVIAFAARHDLCPAHHSDSDVAFFVDVVRTAANGPRDHYKKLPQTQLVALADVACAALTGPRTGLAAAAAVRRSPQHPTGATPAEDNQLVNELAGPMCASSQDTDDLP